MQNCPRHDVPLVFRTGSGEKGPWQVWSCPKKDGDNYCKEKVWSRGKTPAEEMVNLLGDILMAVRASTTPLVSTERAFGSQTPTPTHKPLTTAYNASQTPTQRQDEPIRFEEIPF